MFLSLLRLLLLGQACSEAVSMPDSSRSRRSTSSISGRSRSCDILFAVDEPLWDLRDQNMTHFVEMADQMVEKLNDIFVEQVFISPYDDLYFRVKRIQVVFGSCDGFGSKNCTEQRGKFLDSFDQPRDTSDFCLAYLFTYRDFHNGTAGLAKVGTVCERTGNAGFVTMLNYERERSTGETMVTFAHEVAHNFNASHDDDLKEKNPECSEGSFIMSSSYDGDITSGAKFSMCSVDSMTKKLAEMKSLGVYDECFKEVYADEDFKADVALCGNGVIEEGEECDCGMDEFECHDPCCYPAKVLVSDKEDDIKSISCMRHERSRCTTPPPLIYGIYLPIIFILIGTCIIGIVLKRDWQRDKKYFKHITEGNVRIVRPGAT